MGGSADEAGGEYRAGLAAWLVTLGLGGQDLEGLDLPRGSAIPIVVSLETDRAVDDLNVHLSGEGRLLAQAKRDLTLGSEAFAKTVAQWKAAAEGGNLTSEDRLVLFTESDSRLILALGTALDRRRATDPGAPTGDESEALDKLQAMLADLNVDQRELLLDTATVLPVAILAANAPHRLAARVRSWKPRPWERATARPLSMLSKWPLDARRLAAAGEC